MYSNRGKDKFMVIEKANDLAKYVIHITMNEKCFNPKYDKTLTNDIIEAAKDIYIYAHEANDIKVETKEDWLERAKYQKKAIKRCKRLLALIGLCKSILHLKGSRIKHWSRLIIEVRELLKAWKQSDNKRYKYLL